MWTGTWRCRNRGAAMLRACPACRFLTSAANEAYDRAKVPKTAFGKVGPACHQRTPYPQLKLAVATGNPWPLKPHFVEQPTEKTIRDAGSFSRSHKECAAERDSQ